MKEFLANAAEVFAKGKKESNQIEKIKKENDDLILEIGKVAFDLSWLKGPGDKEHLDRVYLEDPTRGKSRMARELKKREYKVCRHKDFRMRQLMRLKPAYFQPRTTVMDRASANTLICCAICPL